MPTNEAKRKYNIQYAKEKLKRIPLDIQKDKYEEIKAAADAVGEPVNRYIKKAIDERMERENVSPFAEQSIIPNVPKPEPATTPKSTPEKHYKPFTSMDTAKIDLQELLANIHYQLDIATVYGNDALSALLSQAREQTLSQDGSSTRNIPDATAVALPDNEPDTKKIPATDETLDATLEWLYREHSRP